MVAQYNIQAFLKHYQQARNVTVLLTSHYMKDVVALCRRVVVIAAGRIIYDGSLGGIIDRFGGQKIISLEMLDGQTPAGLERYGELLELRAAADQAPPRAGRRAGSARPNPGQSRRGGRERRGPAGRGGDCGDVQTGKG